ncbi:chromosome segregation protein SMC [soil metagenome]
MFKLQRLEITGFKSFADYTEIVFTGNGITAVVGPNGCGKSNVSDSISWVLGEQRAKSLRGGEMKDVVFQGTKSRKPSGMAEVVLHLVRDEDAIDIFDSELEDIDEALSSIDELAVDVDAIEAEQLDAASDDLAAQVIEPETTDQTNGFHSDDVEVETVQAAQVGSVQTVERTVKTKRHWRPRSFALEFAPGEAVSVTRRLYLSGESEYMLNGKVCRLRDINDLFSGTGLSGAHYAIIEQGRIGQILSAKPADRRNLIEEAAGISKFRTRQRAAESRLESAKTNLGRISDIVSEIDKQANSLRRQAAKTRRYVVLQEEFRVLLRRLFAAEGKHFKTLIGELEEQLKTATETEQRYSAQVTEQEATFRTATQTALDAEEGLSDVRRAHAQNALERDRTEREHRYQTEQIIDLQARAEAIELEIDAAAGRLKLAATERERLEIEDQKESTEADASRLILVEAEKQYSDKVDEMRRIEADLDSRRAELMQHTAAVERFDEITRQLEFNLARLSERAAGLEKESLRAEDTHQEHLSEAEKATAELNSERTKLEGLSAERGQLAESLAAARDKLKASEAELNETNSRWAHTRNRLETLQELEEKRAVYAPQVQKLFAEQDNIGIRPLGVLADFLNVNEHAEKAIENLFGDYLQTVIVEDLDAARSVSEWLRSSQIGRVSVLIAPNVAKATSTSDGELPSTVIEALGASPELIEALKAAFPREMSGRIVAELTENDRKGADISISSSGEILYGGSLYVSGRRTAEGKNDSLLAFKRELTGLGKTAAKLEKEAAAAQANVAAGRHRLTAVEEKTVDLQSLIIKVERHLLALELHETTVKQEIERAIRHKKVVTDESEQLAAEVEGVKKRIEEARAGLENAGKLREESRSQLDKVAASLAEAREKAEFENSVLNEKRTMAATSGERRRAVQSAIRRIENEQKELEARTVSLRGELTQAEEKIEQLKASVAEIGGRIVSVETHLDAERKELDAATAAVVTARDAADTASTELADLNRKATEALNERAAIEVRQTEAVTQLRNINENCSQELGIELSELVEREELPGDFVLAEARTTVDDLRHKLEGFGAINMLAVEELAEAEERLLFLTSQRQDIIESIASAEEALREIKERSRERFKNAFVAINENFKTFFSELFGGGRGEMTLLESDDILEAGIEVSAQPPGKRLQNILLLSGGEKAMTAIALVLAIFKYRPSPFCLLDEVDAPLDDANVGRFVGKIAEMSEKTQFIVITHNKRTMEAARALYGVTMQEAGVSKVVSVKFE